MKRALAALTLTTLLIMLALTPVWAQGTSRTDASSRRAGSKEDVEFRRDEIKTPQEFAPPEQIVTGRDPMSFRKDGTLLTRTSREIRKVSQDDLLERKYALYSGRRFYRAPTHDPEEEEERRVRAGINDRVAVVEMSEAGIIGWVFWALIAVLTTMVLIAWRKGWFIPFSVRETARRHTSQAASGKAQSRKKEKPLFDIVRHG